ncbi:hypothetical protein KQI84_17450 [bacterium]|nr:hypothetical protein [bacterium]
MAAPNPTAEFFARKLPRTVILALYVIIPAMFLILAFFCHPMADDFAYAASVREHGFLAVQKYWYLEWSGRWASTILITAFLGITKLDPDLYWIVPVGHLLGMFGGIWVLIRTLAGNLASRREILIAAAGALVIFLASVPGPPQAFYWVEGAGTYTAASILVLLLLATLVRAANSPPKWLPIPIIVLAILTAGMNETTMFLLCGILTLGTAAQFYLRAESRYHWLAALLAAGMGAAIVILAPGNSQRMEAVESHPGIFGALGMTFSFGTEYILAWLFEPVLIGTCILALPFAIRWSAQYLANCPRWMLWAMPVVAVGIGYAGFFPAAWSIGDDPPDRTLGVIYFFFLLGAFASLAAGAELWRRRSALEEIPHWKHVQLAGRLILLAGLLGTADNPIEAAKSLGKATPYDELLEARYARIEEALANGEMNLVVAPIEDEPETIHFDDITEDPEHWRNTACAEFFGLESIRTTEEQ